VAYQRFYEALVARLTPEPEELSLRPSGTRNLMAVSHRRSSGCKYSCLLTSAVTSVALCLEVTAGGPAQLFDKLLLVTNGM
jgi:hypothetical protein